MFFFFNLNILFIKLLKSFEIINVETDIRLRIIKITKLTNSGNLCISVYNNRMNFFRGQCSYISLICFSLNFFILLIVKVVLCIFLFLFKSSIFTSKLFLSNGSNQIND